MSSANSDLSPDHRFLATQHIRYGIRIYDLYTQKLFQETPLDLGPTATPLEIIYVHGGRALATGTCTGNVCVWDTDGRYLSQIQKLPHSESLPVAVHIFSVDTHSIIGRSTTSTNPGCEYGGAKSDVFLSIVGRAILGRMMTILYSHLLHFRAIFMFGKQARCR